MADMKKPDMSGGFRNAGKNAGKKATPRPAPSPMMPSPGRGGIDKYARGTKKCPTCGK